MAETTTAANGIAPIEEVQTGWRELALRVSQLEAERKALEQQNKTLRTLLERVIDHRQKSHTELVVILSTLVSKLPINDVGPIVARLVEHNANVGHYLAALAKGTGEAEMPPQTMLKPLERSKRDLVAVIGLAIEAFLKLDPPLEKEALRHLQQDPELFFSPRMIRANRCFIKGLIPRERIVREFGEGALVFFDDVTTDPNLNRNPKPEEIVLAFRNDFETVCQQSPALIPRRADLVTLYHQMQRSKSPSLEARAQKVAFEKLTFVLELLHYYEHQNTEAMDLVFAQRLPALIEQLAVAGTGEPIDEEHIKEAEGLLAFIISPEHRLTVINNVGKGGGSGRTLKYILRLREPGKGIETDQIVVEFVKHLLPRPPEKPPTPEALAAIVRLIKPAMQQELVRCIFRCERIRKEDAVALGKALAVQLGLSGIEDLLKNQPTLSPEMERQLAWERIGELITRGSDPAVVAAAIRERLYARYDVEEIRQSWITLTEAASMPLIRIFCHLPYLPNGETDPIAQTILETYVTRLMHAKYAGTFQKVVNSLKGLHRAKPDSPTLQSFVAVVRWVDPEAANQLCAQVGITADPASFGPGPAIPVGG